MAETSVSPSTHPSTSLRFPPQLPSDSAGWTRGEGNLDRAGARGSEHLALDTFSPVNENGSFEFDRVLQRGTVLRKSKNKHVSCAAPFEIAPFLCSAIVLTAYPAQSIKASWKPSYMVLRPNLLSVYKDEEEAQLQLSLATCDISAVALVKSPKSKRPNVFGIFSPSKNYRFQAPSAEDAENWVSAIRSDSSAISPDSIPIPEDKHHDPCEEGAYDTSDHDNYLGSSPQSTRRGIPINSCRRRRASHTQEYSGNDLTSCSELSDAQEQPSSFQSAPSLHAQRYNPRTSLQAEPKRPAMRRNTSQTSGLGSTSVDSERVIFQGYLQCLKNNKGVRQWKRVWLVLRYRNLYFYKNEQEYSATKIIPMDQVINAAEIDSIWRSKPFCFQVITEHRTYRFSAANEEAVDKWLGSLTSVLMKLRDEPPNAVVSSFGVE